MRRLLLAALALALWGCPADGPIEDKPDMASQADMGDTPDMAEASVTLSGVDPAEGPVAGGTTVTLTGEGFVDGMTVRFGSGAQVDATVTSATEATATTPASPVSGAVIVVVRNPDGATDSLQGAFTYVGDVQPMGAIGFCQLQAQSPASATTGVASDALYAVVFAEGITQGAGQGTGIQGELGWGSGTDQTAFTYVPTSYNVDADGLNPGDLANDEYGAPLTIPTAGTYNYAARFKLAGEDTWTYCDLDGSDNGIDPAQLGTIEVTDPATPTIGFCRTDTQFVRAQTNQASPNVYGTVFVAGATVGAGAGAGVTAEIAYGPTTDAPDTWTTAAAAYSSDSDGLTPGDVANDVWTATIPGFATAGTYGFAFRFSADGGTTWQLCDTDGTTGASDFDAGAVGSVEVVDLLVELADACNLQFPQIVENAAVGTPIDFFGRVTEPGITGSDTADARLVAELLVGPTNTDPSTNVAAFTTVVASVNTNTVNLGAGEDEYVASYTPTAEGELAFAYRFSVDTGANWVYCGLEDDANPSGVFTTTRMGSLTAATTPDTIDFCHVWQTTLTDDASTTTLPTVTVEVFEDPLTVANGGSNSAQLEVEAAPIPPEINPAFSAASWNPMPYKGLRVGYDNNYEYEGTAYDAAHHPAVGNYNVVVRVRKVGDTTWTYCDTDENAPEFRLDAATPLTISP